MITTDAEIINMVIPQYGQTRAGLEVAKLIKQALQNEELWQTLADAGFKKASPEQQKEFEDRMAKSTVRSIEVVGGVGVVSDTTRGPLQ